MPLHASLTLLVTHMQLRHPCSILLVVLDPPNSSQLVHQVLLNFFSSRQLSSHLVRQMLLNSSTNFFSTSSHLANCLLLISSAKFFSTRPPTSSQLILRSRGPTPSRASCSHAIRRIEASVLKSLSGPRQRLRLVLGSFHSRPTTPTSSHIRASIV